MTLLAEPEHTRGDLRFRFFGVPVRVHPFFWVVTLIMGSNRDAQGALIWVAVCFVSILIHEVGHVIAGRAFGERSDVVLHSFGGLAISNTAGRRSAIEQIVISLAGPGAGFVLGAAVVGVGYAFGAQFFFGFDYYVIPAFGGLLPTGNNLANTLLNDLLFVNIFWGLVNLLPVYPLDGGQATRALWSHRDPFRGVRRSLILSIAAGVIVAVCGLLGGSMYLAAMFGILAAASAQALKGERRSFRPSTSWRG